MLELNEFSKKFQENKPTQNTRWEPGIGLFTLPCFLLRQSISTALRNGSWFQMFRVQPGDECQIDCQIEHFHEVLDPDDLTKKQRTENSLCGVLPACRRLLLEFHTLSFNMLDISLPFRASLMQLRFLPNAFSILSFFSGLQESCLHLFMLTTILILNTE